MVDILCMLHLHSLLGGEVHFVFCVNGIWMVKSIAVVVSDNVKGSPF